MMLLKGRKSFDVTYVVSVSLQASRRIAFRRQRPPRFVVRARMTRFNNFSSTSKRDPLLPSMIVFDLDDCLWTPEMHELPGIPEIPVHEIRNDHSVVVGLQIARFRDTVKLYEGARKVLYELATNPLYEGIELATASSSLEPSYSYACLGGLEILRGLPMGEMMRYNQIGRTGPLTPNKTSHFRLLYEESDVPYHEMLFFDDCNWGDHCGNVTQAFGVVSHRTPNGLQWNDFHQGLLKNKLAAQTRKDNTG